MYIYVFLAHLVWYGMVWSGMVWYRIHNIKAKYGNVRIRFVCTHLQLCLLVCIFKYLYVSICMYVYVYVSMCTWRLYGFTATSGSSKVSSAASLGDALGRSTHRARLWEGTL